MDTVVEQAKSAVRGANKQAKHQTGLSVFNWLTIGSIAASVGLFIAGKKELAIFVGLWPPTFQALKSANQREVE